MLRTVHVEKLLFEKDGYGSPADYCTAQIEGPLSGAVPPVYKADVQITESNGWFRPSLCENVETAS